jgi:hypothetical protein
MRRSAESGGDFGYFDALTKGLELSLRAAVPNRVNVFHITVHPGEFSGGPRAEQPFAVIETWLSEVIDPLVKASKVRWATFSEMSDAYKEWERNNADAPPRVARDASRPETPESESERAHITFVINVHDFGRVDKSADTILRLVELFAKYKVKGDFYLTAPVVEAYAGTRPEVIKRLRDTGMTISYHFRPPHRGIPAIHRACRAICRRGRPIDAPGNQKEETPGETGILNFWTSAQLGAFALGGCQFEPLPRASRCGMINQIIDYSVASVFEG